MWQQALLREKLSVVLKLYNPDNAQGWADIGKERVRRNRCIPEHIKEQVCQTLVGASVVCKGDFGSSCLGGYKVCHETIYLCIRQDKASQGGLV